MRRLATTLRRLHREQLGQATLEWALLLCVVGIPSLYLINILLDVLSLNYQMVTFLETLPFP